MEKFFGLKSYLKGFISFFVSINLALGGFLGILALSYPYLFTGLFESAISHNIDPFKNGFIDYVDRALNIVPTLHGDTSDFQVKRLALYFIALWLLIVFFFPINFARNYELKSLRDKGIFLLTYIEKIFYLPLYIMIYNFFRGELDGNSCNLVINLLVLFIPIIVLAVVDDILSGFFLKVGGVKKREVVDSDEKAEENKLPCMCFRCEAEGIDERYESSYSFYIKRAMFYVKNILLGMGVGYLGYVLYKGSSNFVIYIVFVLVLLSCIPLGSFVASFFARKGLKNEKFKVTGSILRFVEEMKIESGIEILGVLRMEALYSERERRGKIKAGFDSESNAAFLPVGNRKGILFLGHAFHEEDEISRSVLAHEFGHGDKNIISRLAGMKICINLLKFLIIYLLIQILDLKLPNLLILSIVIHFVALIFERLYFRSLERYADLYSKSIVNPLGLKEFFSIVDRIYRGNSDEKGIHSILFSTHPSTKDRIEYLK